MGLGFKSIYLQYVMVDPLEFFDLLLGASVKVFLFQDSLSTFIHRNYSARHQQKETSLSVARVQWCRH